MPIRLMQEAEELPWTGPGVDSAFLAVSVVSGGLCGVSLQRDVHVVSVAFSDLCGQGLENAAVG